MAEVNGITLCEVMEGSGTLQEHCEVFAAAIYDAFQSVRTVPNFIQKITLVSSLAITWDTIQFRPTKEMEKNLGDPEQGRVRKATLEEFMPNSSFDMRVDVSSTSCPIEETKVDLAPFKVLLYDKFKKELDEFFKNCPPLYLSPIFRIGATKYERKIDLRMSFDTARKPVDQQANL